MNLIKQGITVAVIVFIGTMIIGYFIFDKINWILSFGITGGSLIGILLMYLWKKEATKEVR